MGSSTPYPNATSCVIQIIVRTLSFNTLSLEFIKEIYMKIYKPVFI